MAVAPVLIVLSSLLAFTSAKTYDVIILGAGVSGISAAKTLHDQGVTDFVILEAEPQIGGRIKHTQFAGRTVELGARWIHGLQNNPLWELAQKYGLETTPFDYNDWIARDSKGNDVTEQAERDYETLLRAIDKAHEKLQHKVQTSEPDVSYRSALYSASWFPDTPVMDICEWYEFEFQYGLPPEQVPLKIGQKNSTLDFPGGDRLVTDQRGYRYLLVKLSEEFLAANDPRLKLNQVVTQVQYTNHPQEAHVTVTTESGDTFEARYAIITFSLGVFHRNVVQYSPPLPSWKTDVLNNMDLADDVNVYIKFPDGTQPFWDEKPNIVHAHQCKGYYVYFFNYHKIASQNDFISVNVVGNEARTLSRQDKATTIEEINMVLRGMYGDQAVEVEDVLVPDWVYNKLYYGCYSSVTSGMTNKTFHAIPAPIGPLFFAGEHTEYRYFGLIQGAYFSGIRAADEVIECHSHRYCPSTFFVPQSRPGFYYKKRR